MRKNLNGQRSNEAVSPDMPALMIEGADRLACRMTLSQVSILFAWIHNVPVRFG